MKGSIKVLSLLPMSTSERTRETARETARARARAGAEEGYCTRERERGRGEVGEREWKRESEGKEERGRLVSNTRNTFD
jgi:hypothetical protein